MTIFHRFRRSGSSRKIPFIAGIAVAAIAVVSAVTFGLVRAGAATCTDNDILKCGFSSPSDFISKVRANDNGVNSQHDLQAIYAAYGLESADYDRLVTSSAQGTAFRDGHIEVGGVTVATGAKTIGRTVGAQGTNPFTETIGGIDYFGNTNDQAFADGVDSLAVTVLFNAKGEMQFAVLNSCGNPERATPKTPTFSCDMLNKAAVAGQANTFNFTTEATATNNATIAKVVYDFGDGTTAEETNPATPVKHTYASSGTFTAKVTVFVNLPGNQQVQATSATCETTITVTPTPSFECVQLVGAILDRSKMSFTFTVTTKPAGGATFTTADFNFGDGATQNGVAAGSDGITASTTHTYGTAGSFTAKVTVHSTASDQGVTSAACQVTVSPTTPPPAECKPGVPVGSPECTPPTPVTPKVPPVLPNTGAGNVIALSGVAIVSGFLGYRQVLLRKQKASAAQDK